MILTITIWAIAFFVLFSFGDILISGYNKICKNEESYGIMDTVVLGMCSILIPLQALSLFFPSNQYTLALFVAVAVIYWLCNKQRGVILISKIKEIYSSLSVIQKTLILVSTFAVLISILIPYPFYDADCYHYQHIKWNETFATVPGLANLEDRFGFNSNYLLLSSIFTFSFVSGEAYVTIQGLLIALLFIWALINVFKSQYDLKDIVILAFLVVIYIICLQMLKSSSTDIIPILCLFYFLAKSITSTNTLTSRTLFTVVLLTSLISYKFSTVFFFLLCIYIVVLLMLKKEYKKMTFITIVSSVILILWFARNVITSGYLVFPIYQVDLFSFDWKMPWGTLKLEQEHIKEWAYFEFGRYFTVIVGRNIANLIFFIVALLLPLALILKRKVLSKDQLLLAVFSYIAMLLCFANAPDFRFFNGFIFGNALVACLIILDNSRRKIQFANKGIYIACVAVAAVFVTAKAITPLDAICELSVKPIGSAPYDDVEEYKLGDVTILLTNDSRFRSFYTLPCTSKEGLPFNPYRGYKLQSIETIEARGRSLQEGFRTKDKYIDLFNQNVDEYLSDYYKNKFTDY